MGLVAAYVDTNLPVANNNGTIDACDNSDSDVDGFNDRVESFVGTMPAVKCSPIAGPDHTPDEWPVDFNNDQAANLTDIFTIVPHLNTADSSPGSSTRFDLSADGIINLTDLFLVVPFLNTSCAP